MFVNTGPGLISRVTFVNHGSWERVVKSLVFINSFLEIDATI